MNSFQLTGNELGTWLHGVFGEVSMVDHLPHKNRSFVPIWETADEHRDCNCSYEPRWPTCLVIGDDRTMRHQVMNYLEEHDMRPISASEREAVAALVAGNEPSMVILDLRLGQDDGLDLLREIRQEAAVDLVAGSLIGAAGG